MNKVFTFLFGSVGVALLMVLLLVVLRGCQV